MADILNFDIDVGSEIEANLIALLIQKEFRAIDAEKTAAEMVKNYNDRSQAKFINELTSTVVYLENRVMDLEHDLKRALKYLKKCCKKKNKRIKNLLKKSNL